jgi:4-diphosphocytidyl-2-C-methyl-D-erythritol kinase
MSKALKVLSPAKLNLYLEILGKRPDGYHTLNTIFERISLFDEITVRESDNGRIKIESDAKDIPRDSRNLAYKAARLLKKDLGISKGALIRIKKRIPVGAGLGGGSSNAASTLLGLNQLWDLRLSRQKLSAYGAKLGSDVPFFLSGASFAFGNGRGEKIKPLVPIRKKFWHIVAAPRFKVSTKGIYAEFDKIQINTGKRKRIRIDFITKKKIGEMLFNRLEEVTFRKYPKVKELKESLIAQGVKNVLMSGTGGAVFGIVSSRKEGERIAARFIRSKNMKVFVAATTGSADKNSISA